MNKLNGLAILVAAAIALTLAGCGDDKDKGFATVNGATLTNAELIEYLETKQTVRVVANGQRVELPVDGTLAFQALQELIIRKLILQMAKSEGVLPTKAEIDGDIKTKTEINSTYIKAMQAKGLSMKGIREAVEIELAQQNLLSKGIKVEDKEVDEYIKANPKEFEEPAKAEMFWILANAQSKTQVDAELAKGTKFTDVAVKMSLDPDVSKNGGKMGGNQFPGGVPLTTFAPEFADPINATEAGKSTGWIAVPGKPGIFAKINIARKTEARPIEITPAIKKTVKTKIMVSRGAQTKDIQEKLVDMLKKAKIEVTDVQLKELWAKFDEQLKATAESANVPSGGGSGKESGN